MTTNPVLAANTRFGAKLFAELTRRAPGTNLFFSPLSITLALLLAYAGAEAATEQAIEGTLGLKRISHERAAREAAALVAQLAALDNTEAQRTGRFGEVEDLVWLRIANAVFVNRDIPLKPSYIENVRADFSAYVESLDFGSSTAAKTIDAWVSVQTRGKITEIAGQLSRDVAAILLNAIYFKAPWLHAFPEGATEDGDWTLRDGSQIRVPMMANTERYQYGRVGDVQVVGLPFGGNNQLRMLVLVPAHADGIAALQTQVADPAFLAGLNLRPTQVRLRLPRFRIECDTNLNAPLIELGMAAAFDPQRANFSRMAPPNEPLYISEVRHKTFLDVNEKGAEAAAATAIKMMRMSMVVEQPIDVNVDRPFVLAIEEQQAGALLFLGSIQRPTTEGQ